LLTHPTLDQLGQLGLPGMAQTFAELEARPLHGLAAAAQNWSSPEPHHHATHKNSAAPS
jgi:hypothetical protein